MEANIGLEALDRVPDTFRNLYSNAKGRNKNYGYLLYSCIAHTLHGKSYLRRFHCGTFPFHLMYRSSKRVWVRLVVVEVK